MVTLLLLFVGIGIVITAILLLKIIKKQSRQFGVLEKKHVYHDTKTSPGITLNAKTIKLSGKPDYLIKDKEKFIPVEVKTGKTPNSPYVNHTMQLMAYCFLVEENYGVRPPGGYLKYPNKEFKIAYTHQAEEEIRNLVEEILIVKKENKEQTCNHPEHNAL